MLNDLDAIKFSQSLGGSSLRRFAHHPHCDRHNHHLIWVLGHPLCLGCTCMYLGIVVGIPITFAINWETVSLGGWIFIWLSLLVPTVAQPFIQIKFYKIAARFLLGVTISLYFISGMLLIHSPFSEWLFRPLIIGNFTSIYRILKLVRSRFTKSPCDDCPLGYFPTCEWNLPRLLAENTDIEFTKALTSDNLRDMIVK